MRRRFSRSLLGYDPEYVDYLVHLIQQEHATKMPPLVEELTRYEREIVILNRGIQKLEQEIDRIASLEAQLTQALAAVRSEAAARVAQAVNESAQLEQRVRQRVEQKQELFEEIERAYLSIQQEMRALITRLPSKEAESGYEV